MRHGIAEHGYQRTGCPPAVSEKLYELAPETRAERAAALETEPDAEPPGATAGGAFAVARTDEPSSATKQSGATSASPSRGRFRS